jgi:hypothetical protein
MPPSSGQMNIDVRKNMWPQCSARMTQTSKWQVEYPSETLTRFNQTTWSQYRRPRALEKTWKQDTWTVLVQKLLNVVGGTGVYTKLIVFCDLSQAFDETMSRLARSPVFLFSPRVCKYGRF